MYRGTRVEEFSPSLRNHTSPFSFIYFSDFSAIYILFWYIWSINLNLFDSFCNIVYFRQDRQWCSYIHDDVIKWNHFPRYWPFVRGIHRSRWIPRTMASDAELFETPPWSLLRQCNATQKTHLRMPGLKKALYWLSWRAVPIIEEN